MNVDLQIGELRWTPLNSPYQASVQGGIVWPWEGMWADKTSGIAHIYMFTHVQRKTRLTYNCAHLRLNNKKNKNELSPKGPQDWALIFEKSDLTNFLAIPKFLGWKFSCVNFFGVKFLGDNF